MFLIQCVNCNFLAVWIIISLVADRVASRALGDLRGLQCGQHTNKHEKVLNWNLKLLATNLSYLRVATVSRIMLFRAIINLGYPWWRQGTFLGLLLFGVKSTPVTRTLGNSNLGLTRTKINFPWISFIYLPYFNPRQLEPPAYSQVS